MPYRVICPVVCSWEDEVLALELSVDWAHRLYDWLAGDREIEWSLELDGLLHALARGIDCLEDRAADYDDEPSPASANGQE